MVLPEVWSMLRIGRMPAVYWRAGLHFLVHSFCGWESWATGRTGSGEKKEFVLQAIPIEYKSSQEETNTTEEEETSMWSVASAECFIRRGC